MKDSTKIFIYRWSPEEKVNVKGVVQIAHGMAEHGARYESFAEVLVDEGFAVYASDHRGHGKTAGSKEEIGYFADTKGWNKVVDDMQRRQLFTVWQAVDMTFQFAKIFRERHLRFFRQVLVAKDEDVMGQKRIKNVVNDGGVQGR